MTADYEHRDEQADGWKRGKGRDPRRIEPLLQRIREIWTANPDLRLLQLLLNPAKPSEDGFYIEDDRLLRMLELYRPSREMQLRLATPVACEDDGN